MTPDVSSALPPCNTSSEERWAAWVAKGEAHDHLARRKWLVALPILGVVAVLVIIYVLIGARL